MSYRHNFLVNIITIISTAVSVCYPGKGWYYYFYYYNCYFYLNDDDNNVFYTLKAPITTAADDIHKHFYQFFRENNT